MESGQKKKWIIKDPQGSVRGPFQTDDVIRQIRLGEIQGGEKIALFPGTEWFPISQAPEFYDQLLSALQGLPVESEPNFTQSKKSAKSESVDNWTSFEKKSEPHSAPKARGRAERVTEESNSPKAEPMREKVKKENKTWKNPIAEVIELKRAKDVIKKIRRRKSRLPGLIIAASILLVLGYILLEPQIGAKELRLLEPLKGKPQLPQSAITKLLQEGGQYLSRGNLSDYLAAQNKFVQAYEANNSNPASLSLLCLTYYHLWPFVAQDSEDLRTLTKVTQYVSQINPTSIEAFTCRSIDLILRGRSQEAMSNVDSVIEAQTRSNNPPTAFYYLKAQLLKDAKEYSASQSYARSAQQYWPQWIAAYFVEAESLLAGGKPNEAAKVLNGILTAKPDHHGAQLLTGIVEARAFRNYDRAEKFLKSALAREEEIPKMMVAEGLLAFAEMRLAQGSKGEALKLAKRSYALQSMNERTRALIVQIGGESSLQDASRADKQLIYEGDQLVREGNCLAAQAMFKTAFDLNRKNAIAAMKAAECLWRLSLATEAIDWLNKAIGSDYKLIDAYVLLADYYSQRFMFQQAAQVLQSAAQADSKNYKVYRGLAQLELRRRNGKGAAAYANQAIQLYESDVDSYVILARSHILIGEDNKALVAAGKAVEIDINNREAQIAYAESIFGAQGAATAIDYMTRLVSLYPLVSDYRFALGEIYMRNESYSDAITMFNQVAEIDDKPKKALMAIGQVYQRRGEFDKALDSYLKAAAIDPSDVDPLFQSGLLYLETGKPLDAKGQFGRVLRVNKDYPLANYYLGKAALQMNVPTEALQQAKIEAQRNPNLADPYILAAEAYDALEQYGLCASEFQKAAKLRPASSALYVKMAKCYRLAGSLDSSLSMLRIAQKLESGNADVYRELGLVFQTKGDNALALEAYNQYLVLAPNAPDVEQVKMQKDKLLQ